ncbi:MAG: hypothetical protein WA821_10925, partial [Anaerolineales bacterium]
MNKNYPIQFLSLLRKNGLRRGSLFGIILLVALLAFEVFNYSTTDFALTDLLGKDLTFAGLRWATILSIAFCGIDFAGIARLFTPEQGRDEPAEVWYLFGAWLLAAAMNAALTWWGVAVAISNHSPQGTAMLGQETLTKVIPVFVAIMVWIIRLLLIGTFAMAGERLFSMADQRPTYEKPVKRFDQAPARPATNYAASPRPSAAATPRPSAAVARPQ